MFKDILYSSLPLKSPILIFILLVSRVALRQGVELMERQKWMG
jgi:hypothetical protein